MLLEVRILIEGDEAACRKEAKKIIPSGWVEAEVRVVNGDGKMLIYIPEDPQQQKPFSYRNSKKTKK